MTNLDIQTIFYAEVDGVKYHLKRLGDEGAMTLDVTRYNFIDDKEETSTYESLDDNDFHLILDVVRHLCEGFVLVEQRKHDEGVIHNRLDVE